MRLKAKALLGKNVHPTSVALDGPDNKTQEG